MVTLSTMKCPRLLLLFVCSLTNVITVSKSGRLKREFLGHTRRISSMVLAVKGSILFTASADCTIRVWVVKVIYLLLHTHIHMSHESVSYTYDFSSRIVDWPYSGPFSRTYGRHHLYICRRSHQTHVLHISGWVHHRMGRILSP